ncbi:MAG: YhcN/YlaJ family sporulation lipoprotein [Anaerotignum sp.]|nr:YhcN/YlaJ family sporulation lipoprotein [Anaerotignum sp.]
MKKWIVFGMLLFLTGCRAEMTEESQQQLHFVKAEQEVGDKTPEERALAIKMRLDQIEGVIGTAVVVEGHTAIIGLRMQKGMEQNEMDAVKRKADAAAMEAEASIESTSITTNSYIVSLIEDLERKRAG